jgi:hypothetical protein
MSELTTFRKDPQPDSFQTTTTIFHYSILLQHTKENVQIISAEQQAKMPLHNDRIFITDILNLQVTNKLSAWFVFQNCSVNTR